MRVLIIKLSSLGDVIHTLPAINDAAKAIPDIQFDWLIEEAYVQVPAWHKAVKRVIPVALRRWRKQILRPSTYSEWRACKKEIKQSQYDYVIDAQGLLKSALLSKLARGVSYGLDTSSARESLAALCYQNKHTISTSLHAITRIRELFALTLGYAMPKTEPDYGIASDKPKNNKEYMVCIHGSARTEKKWPLTHWQTLITMIGEAGYQVKIPWGNRQELAEAKIMASAHTKAEVLESMDLNELRHILQGALAVAACDTGLAHLGAALGRPMTVVYGKTDPKLIGTCGRATQTHLRADNLCDISPEHVWQKLSALPA